MDPQDLEEQQAALRKATEELQKFGYVTAETAKQLELAGNWTAKFTAASLSGAKDLGKGVKSMAGALARGESSFDTLNPLIDATSNALGGMAKAIPFAGEAISAGVKLVAEGSKFLLAEMSKNLRAFQQLSSIGGITATGISGLQSQFLQSGLTLEAFQSQVMENSMALARFRGVTADGISDFSKIVGDITQGEFADLGNQLRTLGYSANAIGETASAFVARETRLGRAQTMTTKELSLASVNYMKELDLLSKVTGQSRAQIIDSQAAALSETRFRAATEKMRGTADEKNIDGLLELNTILKPFGDGSMAQGMRDLATGGVGTSSAATQLFVESQGAAQSIVNDLKRGNISAAEAAVQLQQALTANKKLILDQGGALGDTDLIGNIAGIMDYINTDLTGGTKARVTQQGQLEGQDALTNSAVIAEKELQKMSISMTRFAFKAMPAAADIVEEFTKSISTFLDVLSDTMGINLDAGGGTPKFKPHSFGVGGTQPTADGMNFTAEKEGFSQKIYTDSTGNKTIGYGHKLLPGEEQKYAKGISRSDARDLFAQDYEKNFRQGTGQMFFGKDFKLNKAINNLSQSAKDAIGDLSYNLGGGFWNEFPGFKKAIEDGNIPAAQAELKNSKWYTQVGTRADEVIAKLGAANGGILSGPKSGYTATLHGTEAVVPLPDGNSIPVSMAGAGASTEEQLSMMQQQISRFDDMIQLLVTQNNISNRILSASYS